MDFTIKVYEQLLMALKNNAYSFQTVNEFLKSPDERVIILRHDVDLLPENSLRFAEIQNEFGIKGTYYFRAVPESWDEEIILKIASLGHEIGYHYETMDTASEKLKAGGNQFQYGELIDLAYDEFCAHLETLRKLVPVDSICMHGSPRSQYDNKEIWKKYDYMTLGINGEPYFDVNYNDVFYLTDTGRRWDGFKVSVRDKVSSNYTMTFHTTDEIIEALNSIKLPNRIMFTFHPQRWHDDPISWFKELIFQNSKNLVKQFLFVKK